MTPTNLPTVVKTPRSWGCGLGQPLAWKQLALGGANGSKITAIQAASTDSATKIVSLAIGRQIPLTSISNATPAVLTATAAHKQLVQDILFLTAAGGALGTGLVAWDDLTTGTTYNVIAAGLTATAFEVALGTTPQGGGTTAINTSGASSGTLIATALKMIGSVQVAALAGTDGVTGAANMLASSLFPGLPVDADGVPYIFLDDATVGLYAANTVALTANKVINLNAFGGDF